MSIREDLRVAMYNELFTQVTTLPIGTENQKFEQPENAAFVKVWIMESSAKQAAIGTTKKFKRHIGNFVIQCFVPEKSGIRELNDICDSVSDALEDKSFTLSDGSYVTTYTPEVITKGKDGGHYSNVVMVKYILDAAPK